VSEGKAGPALGRWWCELAWLGGEDATADVLLEAGADGSFSRVEPGVQRDAAGDAVALFGLALPGLVSAHSHAFHRALRAWTQRDGGSFWTWRQRMYDLAGRLDPDRYWQLASAAFAELALAGVTTVGEFLYLHRDRDGRPYAGDPFGDAVVEAAASAGVRLTLLDACYLAGGVNHPLDEVQRRFGDGDAEAWAARVGGRADGPLLRVGGAIHSVRAVPPAQAEVVAAWAGGRGAPLHAHVSEQPAENEDCLAAYGRTPTGVLADIGALGPGFTAVHATHLTADDVALLGGSGSAVCLCPTTERDLADGIGPAAALRRAGSPLSLGSDSHAVVDLFEEARAVELDERLASGARGTHAPADLLAAATAGGAQALGWPGGGRLAVGAPADLCVVDLRRPQLAGTVSAGGANAAAAAVFAADASTVIDVVVAGRPVVAGGRHVLGDVGALLAGAVAAVWEG